MDALLIEKEFQSIYKNTPRLFRSPGRINLIGEHTDYNEGFVLPAAIDREMVLAIAENNNAKCRFYSVDYKEFFEVDLHNIHPSEKSWANYLLGVVAQFQKAGYKIKGFDCVFGGDIPIGAGLSSSAALECAMSFAINEVFNLGVEKLQLVKFAQKAEHEYAGVHCGIMDQFASIMGLNDYAMRLDCRSLECSYFPIILRDYQIILCDTQVKHSLASSEYNTRRMECEEGLAVIRSFNPAVISLRDVTSSMLAQAETQMDPKVYNRCKYVVEENKRLLAGCEMLQNKDIQGFGLKMYGSHDGLSKLYEVSCEELDFLVDYTRNIPFIAGARMMGGGFGGCTINLVDKEYKEEFIAQVKHAYHNKFSLDLQVYEVKIANGTGEIKTKVEETADPWVKL